MGNEEEQPMEVHVPSWMKLSKIIVWLLYFWVIIGIISLFLRVILLAFSANPGSSFVDFVYRVSSDYLEPFRGIFPPQDVGETGYLDISSIFAIIVYLFVAWGFNALIHYIQNKIDLTTAEQEAAIRKAEHQKNLMTQKEIAAKKAKSQNTVN